MRDKAVNRSDHYFVKVKLEIVEGYRIKFIEGKKKVVRLKEMYMVTKERSGEIGRVEWGCQHIRYVHSSPGYSVIAWEGTILKRIKGYEIFAGNYIIFES